MIQPATASWPGCDGPGGGRAVLQEGQAGNQNIPTVHCVHGKSP